MTENREVDYPVLSFFSGAMGLDLGLTASGLNILSGQELDRHAVDTVRTNGERVLAGDIRELLGQPDQIEDYLSTFKLGVGDAFAFVGGPPCQSFSTAGRRQGVDDERGMLIFDYLDVVAKARPRFMVLENVKGLLSSRDASGGLVIETVLERLSSMGYRVVSGVVDASHYGAPQFRERLLIIASRDGEEVFLPAATHFQTHQSPDHRWVTLRAAIEDLESDPGPYVEYSPRLQRVMQLVNEGGNWRSLPRDVAQEAMGGAWLSGGGKVGYFRRLRYDEPSPTLVTSPTQKATMLTHPSQDRPLSVREYARIQGFPDDWTFSGSIAAQYRQIGNAVPLALGTAIGQMLRSVDRGDYRVNSKRSRGTSTHKESLNRLELSTVANTLDVTHVA
jgi:DNA (cytosine-5)-methyltransferase 1